jgi:HEAT repeat protein
MSLRRVDSLLLSIVSIALVLTAGVVAAGQIRLKPDPAYRQGGQGAPTPPDAVAPEPQAPQSVAAEQLQAAIDKLGDFDYDTRTAASRTVRRTIAAQAVPALLQAVSEHADGYVRYRALVLLTGFNDPRTTDAMRESRTSANDRLRTVAYSFFEHHPDRAMVNDLLAALEKEQGEFVRPALTRALAAHAAMYEDEARLRETLVREVKRGEDYFRSAVIESLGDFRALYAFDALVEIATLEGPLQDDAALALGKLGDKRALPTLAMLQQTAPRPTQPILAAAICLLGVNCGSHQNYLIETLKFTDRNLGFQELLRSAAAGLAALAVAGGHDQAVDALFEVGIPAQDDTTRAPVSLALGAIALRNTRLMLKVLGTHAQRDAAIGLIAEGFDGLEEDLDKETFFVTVRRGYWDAPEGSPTRQLMQTLIGKLDF